MKLICMGEEYPCVWAEKDEAAGTVTAYGEAGNVVVRAVKVSDFSDYIIKDGHWYTMPLNEIKTDKEAELAAACKAAITAGMDVETSQGTEHFALQETDQINLTTALSAVQAGVTGYPYHADGALCRMFTAEEIRDIATASIKHKLYHTTLCNHLLMWVRRTAASEELESITYTAEGLPEDLAANMARVLALDGGGADV